MGCARSLQRWGLRSHARGCRRCRQDNRRDRAGAEREGGNSGKRLLYKEVPDFEPRARLQTAYLPRLSLVSLLPVILSRRPCTLPFILSCLSLYSLIYLLIHSSFPFVLCSRSSSSCDVPCPRLAHTCFSFLSSFVVPLRHDPTILDM
jgi:hypothetical protein